MLRKQQGFTLVEIAIVMVIIGLLLGGVLKGQEVITNAKLKRVVNDFNSISAAVFTYQDRYRALPGDDRTASTKFTNTPPGNGSGNGQISGNFFSTNDADESRLLWRHLREAGLVAGGEDDFEQPSHAYGGIMGVEVQRLGLRGHAVCFDAIDAEDARLLDVQNDDGVANTGAVRGGRNRSAAADAAGYTDGQIYNVCFRM